MHVVVCVKQVPDTTNVRINPETNTLMREGVESIVNPFDEYALEQGLMLKDRHGARLTVVSMGPPQAAAVLRESLARGADEAVLVSSRAFGGADTLATSYTIAQAIKKACGGKTPDLVLFGKQAIDGDTAQVGPGVSEFLGVPLVTYVRKIDVSMEDGTARFSAESVMDDAVATIEGALPAVMTVLKEADAPRYAPLSGAIRAANAEVLVFDEKDIAANPAEIGLKGSPTKVVEIFPPPIKGGGEKIVASGEQAAKAIVDFLYRKGLVEHG
jgi:electron transfer flavoprotein beta subunit